MDLKHKAKTLPEKPGVYLMKDFMNNIIYIGKSRNLKNRVTSYFVNSKNHSPKIIEMVGNVDIFEYILTDTELEALLLESKLIKKYKPMYNSLLKNTKRYVYLKITITEKIPRFVIVYEKSDENALYFGPFTSIGVVEQAIDFFKDNYPIAQCNNPNHSSKNDVCLNYHLKKCLGVCKELISHSQYMNYINEIIAFLHGKNNMLINKTETKMNLAVQNLDFKNAARYRDQLSAAKSILKRQEVISNSSKGEKILAAEILDDNKIKIFLIMGNTLVGKENIKKESLKINEVKKVIKELIIGNFFQNDYNNYNKISKEDIDEILIISSYLNNKQDNFYFINMHDDWLHKKNNDDSDKVLLKFIEAIFDKRM